MKSNLEKVFGKSEKIIIGAIHLPSLLGSPKIEDFTLNMISDLEAFENGGVDGIIFENNYDSPHTEFVPDNVATLMLEAGKILKAKTRLPIGVSVLWNDYKTALSIARELNLKFIRVPAFVDMVEASYGVMPARAKEVLDLRKKIFADNVFLFTDIHVKHSKLLSPHTFLESAKLAIDNDSDAIIVTGRWTGDAPDLEKLRELRSNVKDFPIFIGSGTDEHNVGDLLKYANGAIVSTSLKSGEPKSGETNVKSYRARIDGKKVKRFMDRMFVLS